MDRPDILPRRAVIGVCSGLLLGTAACLTAPGLSQEQGYGQTLGNPQIPQQRDAFRDGPGEGNNILDASNPLELMNRLRRANSLNDATSPSSAIDQALREFEAQSSPGGPGSSGPGPTQWMTAP
jgi:hypothetical protein